MNFLIDTCVISELICHKPEEKVVNWLRSVPEDMKFISAVTVGEIHYEIHRLPDSHRKAGLALWMNHDLVEHFGKRILSVDTQTMLIWGALIARLVQLKQPASNMDVLIAATALQHNMILCTRNVKDFATCGLEIVNPWD